MDDLGVQYPHDLGNLQMGCFCGKKTKTTWDLWEIMGLKKGSKNQKSDIWVCLKIVQPPSTKIMINQRISRY